MSTKPTDIATWTGNPISPSAGKRTAGFSPAEKPPAQYFDYLFGLAGQWQQYLSDGNLQGAHTFNSTVGITGLLTASGGITVTGGTSTDTLAVSGATVLGGTLAVTGAVNFPEPRIYSIGFAVLAAGATLNLGSSGNRSFIALGTSGPSANLPLDLRIGSTLSAWSIRLNKASATGTIVAKLWKNTAPPTQIGSTQSNGAASPGLITLGQSGLSEVVGSDSYLIELIGGGTTGDSAFDYQDTST